MEIELGCPVIAKVLLDGAAGTLAASRLVVGHVESEAVPSGNGMNMARDDARIDNRIGTLVHETSWACHTPIGVCGGGESTEGEKVLYIEIHICQ